MPGTAPRPAIHLAAVWLSPWHRPRVHLGFGHQPEIRVTDPETDVERGARLRYAADLHRAEQFRVEAEKGVLPGPRPVHRPFPLPPLCSAPPPETRFCRTSAATAVSEYPSLNSRYRTASTAGVRSGNRCADGTRYGIPACRIFCLARTRRLDMAAVVAVSGVERGDQWPPYRTRSR